MEISTENYSALVSSLYSSLLKSRSIQDILVYLRQAINADSCILVLRYPAELDAGLILSDGLPSSVAASSDNPYSGHFYKFDPFVYLPEGKVMTLEEFVPEGSLRKSEFYQQLLQPNGIHHILAVDLHDDEGINARFRFLLGVDSGGFQHPQRELLNLLVPHLRQILKLYQQHGNAESERSLYESAISQSSVACIILDESRRVLHTNSNGAQLLERDIGFGIKDGILQLASRSKNQELDSAIERVLANQCSEKTNTAELMTVPSPHDTTPIGLVLKSVPRSEWMRAQSTPSVAVFVNDPEAELTTSISAIQALFELTTAEARLSLLLAGGRSLEKVTSELGISTNTGRAHLRSIFSKTGVTQQTQLVSLILRSVANLG